MAGGSETTADPGTGSYPGLAVRRTGLQATAQMRAKDLQAGPQSSQGRDRENEHEESSHISKTSEGALVSAPDFAAPVACTLLRAEQRTEDDRTVPWSGPRSCLCG